MSFFFDALRRHDPGGTLPRPQDYMSAESFAYALMRAGVDADTARQMLADARRKYEAQLLAEEAENARERREDWRERQREANGIAARRLMREAGWETDDDPRFQEMRG